MNQALAVSEYSSIVAHPIISHSEMRLLFACLLDVAAYYDRGRNNMV